MNAPGRAHALFRQFPPQGRAQLSCGEVPTPYHVYDGHGLFIGGSADAAAVRELLACEPLHPVTTDDGRALVGLWVFDFRDASLGPHHELQVSIFVIRQPAPPLPAHRLALLEAMLARPEVQMLCHGLWNDRVPVVAYNRELLGLDARLSTSTIARDARSTRFAVRDAATGRAVVDGEFRRHRWPSLHATLSLVRHVGLRRITALAREPWIRMPVVNPIGPHWPHNAAADTYTRADHSVLRHADPAGDCLAFGDERYRALGFQPQFVQALDGFKFVYLFPRPAPAAPAAADPVLPTVPRPSPQP